MASGRRKRTALPNNNDNDSENAIQQALIKAPKTGRPRKFPEAKTSEDQALVNASLESEKEEGYNHNSRSLLGEYKCKICPTGEVKIKQRKIMVQHIKKKHAALLVSSPPSPPSKRMKSASLSSPQPSPSPPSSQSATRSHSPQSIVTDDEDKQLLRELKTINTRLLDKQDRIYDVMNEILDVLRKPSTPTTKERTPTPYEEEEYDTSRAYQSPSPPPRVFQLVLQGAPEQTTKRPLQQTAKRPPQQTPHRTPQRVQQRPPQRTPQRDHQRETQRTPQREPHRDTHREPRRVPTPPPLQGNTRAPTWRRLLSE